MNTFTNESPRNIGTLSIEPDGVLPAVLFQNDDVFGADCSMSEKGLSVSISHSPDHQFILFRDNETNIQVAWLAQGQGFNADGARIDIVLPPEHEAWYTWNHIVVRNNRLKPAFSIAGHVSRNLWLNCRMDPTQRSVVYTYAQLMPGPAHCAWIMRPGAPFAVKSFKEVGNGETGGIKFRIDEYQYLLFLLQDSANENQQGTPVPATYDGYAVLRYIDDELDAFWNITTNEIRCWR